MDYLPLMVRTLSMDTPIFPTKSLRQAGEIPWLKMAVFVILCRLVWRVTTQQQRYLLVLDPSHLLVALFFNMLTGKPSQHIHVSFPENVSRHKAWEWHVGPPY